jgi:hypothetical protein
MGRNQNKVFSKRVCGDMKKFTIEMNEQHMRVMTAALETFTRLLMGQINIVFEQVPGLSYDDRQFMQLASRQVMFKDLPPNASYGIGNEKLDDRANVAYEMRGLIENAYYDAFIKKDLTPKYDSYLGPYARQPLKVSGQPFIKIEEKA